MGVHGAEEGGRGRKKERTYPVLLCALGQKSAGARRQWLPLWAGAVCHKDAFASPRLSARAHAVAGCVAAAAAVGSGRWAVDAAAVGDSRGRRRPQNLCPNHQCLLIRGSDPAVSREHMAGNGGACVPCSGQRSADGSGSWRRPRRPFGHPLKSESMAQRHKARKHPAAGLPVCRLTDLHSRQSLQQRALALPLLR